MYVIKKATDTATTAKRGPGRPRKVAVPTTPAKPIRMTIKDGVVRRNGKKVASKSVAQMTADHNAWVKLKYNTLSDRQDDLDRRMTKGFKELKDLVGKSQQDDEKATVRKNAEMRGWRRFVSLWESR